MKLSALQCKKVTIGRVELHPFPEPISRDLVAKHTISAKPTYLQNRNSIREWRVCLDVVIKRPSDGSAYHYEGRVDLMGYFEVLEQYPEADIPKIVGAAAPAILYGLARGVILDLTARCMHGIYILPSVTFNDVVLGAEEAADPDIKDISEKHHAQKNPKSSKATGQAT